MASTRPVQLWKYPVRAATDVAVMLLGLFLAIWPLVVLFVILKIIF
jgi:hypothetical protein